MADESERLPGEWVIDFEDITKFYKGDPFKIMNPSGEIIECDPPDWQAFDYYTSFWDDWMCFNVLPHGGGTAHELPWLIDILKFYDRIKREIQEFKRR